MAPSPSPSDNGLKAELDLLSTIFGTEEAKKHLLNVVTPPVVDDHQIVKDSQAMDLMMRTYPWRVYQQALWRKLLTAMRRSLAAPTLEEREAARNQVLAHLGDLHLPYELQKLKASIEERKRIENGVKSR